MGRENLRCRRCYRILHYGQRDEGGGSREDHLAAIRRGIREAGLVVMVFDLVDFEGSWSEEINSLVGTKPLLAVLNKSDLLPRQVKPEEAEIWAGNRLQELGREPVAVIPVSSTRGWGIKRLTGVATTSPLSGQRAVRQQVLKECGGFAAGFGVEVELTIKALRLGYQIREIDLPMTHRPTGRNLSGFMHRGKQLWMIIKVLVKAWRNK